MDTQALITSLRPKLRPKQRKPRTPLSPTQEIELLAWDKARKYLGTYKEWRKACNELGTRADKARAFGVSEGCVRDALVRLRKREIK
jgi:hypothetical protein